MQQITSKGMCCNTNAVSLVQYMEIKTIRVTAPSVGELRYLTFSFNKYQAHHLNSSNSNFISLERTSKLSAV